jgi:hypothetical protein
MTCFAKSFPASLNISRHNSSFSSRATEISNFQNLFNYFQLIYHYFWLIFRKHSRNEFYWSEHKSVLKDRKYRLSKKIGKKIDNKIIRYENVYYIEMLENDLFCAFDIKRQRIIVFFGFNHGFNGFLCYPIRGPVITQ